jgi:hypothetical protein
VGYYCFFLGLQSYQNESASKKLDDDQYAGSQTLTFRIPLSVPYYTDNNEYERVKGHFEKDGETYQLVKQKLLHDTLYIVCFKDDQSKKINQELADYVKTFSDKPEDNQTSSGVKLPSNFSKDYLSQRISISIYCHGWVSEVSTRTLLVTLVSTFAPSMVHPPERVVSS